MCQSSTLVSTELRTRVIKWGFYNIQESNTIAHYLSILGPASNRDLICGTNDKMCRPIMPQTVRMPSQWHSLRLQRSASCNYQLLKVIKNHTYLLLHYNKLNYYLMTLNYAKCSCFCICDYVWNGQVLENLASPYGVANQTRSTSVTIGPNCLPYKTGLTEAPDWSELRDVRAGHHWVETDCASEELCGASCSKFLRGTAASGWSGVSSTFWRRGWNPILY